MLTLVACTLGACSKPPQPAKGLELATPPRAQSAPPVAPQAAPDPGVAASPGGNAPAPSPAPVAPPVAQNPSVVTPVRVITVDAAFATKQPKAAAPRAAGPQDVLDALNRALSAHLATGKPAPATIEDLVHAGALKRLPAAPPGMKFTIDAAQGQVVLAPAGGGANR
ncbi:MAG: hypothetical protein FJ386_08970 [Verrucomicrobia bacterium]|nr:hypothetical protein [Verrucomicrobiota bacterium]